MNKLLFLLNARYTKETLVCKGIFYEFTLDFGNWVGAQDATSDDLEAMIARFEEQNPNIKINSQPTPFNESLQSLLTRSLGGDAPDVSMAHVSWAEPLAEAMETNGDVMAVPWAARPVRYMVGGLTQGALKG